MATRNNIGRVSLNDGLQVPSRTNLDDSLQSELERLLQEQRNQQIIGREKDLNIYRSGSAPPTVEGSLSAVGSLFRNSNYGEVHAWSTNANDGLTEDQIRSHPAYLSYYYSHQNINPRLPPPLMSKEDWRVAQRFQDGGSSIEEFGDWRKKSVTTNDGSSLFSVQPGLALQQAENELMELRVANASNLLRQNSVQLLDTHSDGMTRLSGGGIGARRKSFADIIQEGPDQSSSISSHLSRPASCNSFRGVDSTGAVDLHPALSHNYGTAAGSSLSRGTTPDLPVSGRSISSGLPPLGNKVYPIDKKSAIGLSSQNSRSSSMTELHDILSSMSGLNLSRSRNSEQDGHAQILAQGDMDNKLDLLLSMSNGHESYIDVARRNELVTNLNGRKGSKEQVNLPRRTYSSANLYSKVNPLGLGSSEEPNVHHPRAHIATMDFSSHVPALSAHGERERQHRNHVNNIGASLHSASLDPHFVPSVQRTSEQSLNNLSSSSVPEMRSLSGSQCQDSEALQKAYLQVLLAQQMQQYELLHQGKSAGLNHGFYGNQLHGIGMPYLGNQFGSSGLTSVGSERPLFEDERISHFASMVRSSMGGSAGSWHADIGNMEGRFTSSLLDEFKNDKTRSFELADIVGHVVQFSTDQYGSRFIQQKLETATEEAKNKIFPEIIPHARTLMTDVFGNYVIQKFFEHGTESQRKELASQLTGHVLPLSLQMYGCRVMQKALEVVDVDQQSAMVAELDGAVMKCVRDQNGNHVIQKCIECVPQDRIQFIVSSFYKQVVVLSTHPYGCRVIQRVLEYCDDPNTQQTIMDEIMQSVCTLAQDQYGNYVIQHVLQHGKPHERSAIISQLAGQIVKMSQQKFASNVVEKCLTYGSPEERQILVNEMLGTTDENEPLQAMMKDPFGNYVVQKVLETCDDRNLELILSRIKVHLNALKKYTYGKHIVSRVEKLITTGERRIGMMASFAS